MRTRLILATAVSLSMIGAASYAVNHPTLVAAIAHLGAQEAAQDAMVVEAAATETTEAVATDTAMETTPVDADTAVETETVVEADVVADSTDHADHETADMQADVVAEDAVVTPEG
tara:strand:+ start:1526 stop:1873 length:348 start_codon:yes stop_codon:yes gene_type:complete